MKRVKILKYLFLSLMSIFLLIGCTGEGKIKIHNNTNHELFAEIDGKDYIIPASIINDSINDIETISVGFDIEKGSLFSDNEKEVNVSLFGPTFAIMASYTSEDTIFTDETKVTIKDGKTTNIYTKANTAGVRIINNSNQKIIYAFSTFYFSNVTSNIGMDIDFPIMVGESKFQRIYPSSNNETFYVSI